MPGGLGQFGDSRLQPTARPGCTDEKSPCLGRSWGRLRDTRFHFSFRSRAVEPAIHTEHLTKVFGNEVIAVNDMNLDVPQGAIFGFLGPNGAGKTTTLRLLLGLQRATAGCAYVFGRKCGPDAVDVRQMIGYLPTNPRFPGHLKPVEYLDLVGCLCRIPADVRKPRIASLIRAVGLLSVTDQRIATLSTGETTRLGIAAALVADPPLLIWDEPTAGLDPAARRFALDLIRELGEKRTIVVATHILNDIDQVCDHVGVMHEGRMIFVGTMAEMKRRIRSEIVVIEVAGEDADLAEFRAWLDAQPDIGSHWDGRARVSVALNSDLPRAKRLAEILERVDACRLQLQGIGSTGSEAEHAYLQLLQEDQSHGFHRFDELATATDADGGDGRS